MNSSLRHRGGEGAPAPAPAGRSRRCAAALASLGCLLASACAAPDATLRRLDEAQPRISRGIADVVDAVDRAFGSPRIEDRERIVSARIGVSLTLRENAALSPGLPLSLRVPLPALERKANVYLQLDSTAESFGSFGDAATSLDRNKALAIAFLTRVADLVDTGARLDIFWNAGPQIGVRPFARYEGRRDPYRGRIEQQVYTNTDVGLGERTIFQVDRLIDGGSYLRLLLSARAEGGVAGLEQEYAVIYRRPLPRWDAALSAETGIAFNHYNGDPVDEVKGNEADPDEGYARLRLTGRMLRPWIEYEITPAIFRPWRHADPWEIGVTLAVRFIYEDYLRKGRRTPVPAPPAPAPVPVPVPVPPPPAPAPR